MLEPLSEPRRRLLVSLNLCTPADFRRARSRVRQLARDLPAFDSVWIDALVQLRKLTPFQARLLESSQPEQLRIGPCILIHQIGGGPLANTYLARGRRSTERFVAKVLRPANPLSTAAEERIRELIQRLKGLKSPYVVGPETCHQVSDRLVLISPIVEGPHLGELLVRRGRFPPAVVWELARQLAAGLVELERRNVVHGDIRVDNARLRPAGTVTMVDAGVRGALDADLSVHSGLPPGHYDGVAPERIGSTASATPASDLYGLGCLLWQLLAGRPPFPAGDPLFKLAAHQSRDIDDVRKWSPETPPDLAEGIRAMTRRDPNRRPKSASELLARWGAPTSRGKRALAAFYRQFSRPAPLPSKPGSRHSPRTSLAPLILLAALLAGAWLLPQSRVVLLSLGARWSRTPEDATSAAATTTTRRATRLVSAGNPGVNIVDNDAPGDLPDPDPKGTIRLEPGRKYRARSLVHVGDLRIVGDRESPAEIVIGELPWKLAAETIRIDGVSIRRFPSALADAATPDALISLRSQSARLDACLVVTGNPREPAKDPRLDQGSPTLIEWKVLSSDDLRNAHLSFHNCVLAGEGVAVHSSRASRIEFRNTLCVGASALCDCEMPGNHGETRVLLDRTTCRNLASILRLRASEGSSSIGAAGRMLIDTQNCVFDVDHERGTVFELTDSIDPSRLQISGEGSLVPEGLPAVARRDDAGEVDSADIQLEGLIAAPFQFTGNAPLRPADSEIAECEAPRRSPLPPGIVAADLLRLP